MSERASCVVVRALGVVLVLVDLRKTGVVLLSWLEMESAGLVGRVLVL